MKKYFTKSLMILATFNMIAGATTAQKVGDVQPNNTEKDCNDKTIMIGDIIALGKPVLITHQMSDCSRCKEAAEEIESFVKANSSKISFVMGMSRMMGNASCDDVASWLVDYPAYKSFTSFIDNDKTYQYGTNSMPNLTVIDPKTKKITYIGRDVDEAKAALGLLMPTATETANSLVSVFEVFPNPTNGIININLQFNNIVNSHLTLTNMLGHSIIIGKENSVASLKNVISTSQFAKGVYILQCFVNEIPSQSKMITIE